MRETREVYVRPRDTLTDQHFNATGEDFQIPKVVGEILCFNPCVREERILNDVIGAGRGASSEARPQRDLKIGASCW